MVGEPKALTMWKETTTGSVIHIHEIITNALIGQNQNSEPIPRLAAELPSVDRGTWHINADGTMDTTYKLQPNAVWHDGTPFTAHDVVFSANAQLDPRVELFVRTLKDAGVDQVSAADDKTVVMHWTRTYGFADSLIFWDFTPLPAHVLEGAYQSDVLSFNQHPYWSDPEVFVGTGPYKLMSWTRGAQMELQAFDAYYLGQPKIDRIVISFVADDNGAVGRVLSGDADVAWVGTWTKSNMDQVRSRGLGDFIVDHENYSHIVFQFKDIAVPLDLAKDVRLRRALAYATDKDAINQAGTDGLGLPADSWIPPDDARYAAADSYIEHYPYDPQRAQQMFTDAGWVKGPDGLLHNGAGQPFSCLVRGAPGVGTVGVASVIANNWHGVGVDSTVEELPTALTRDLEARATFTCVEHSARTLGRTAFQHLQSSNAMLPENHYAGSNRGAYMNPELDRGLDGFFSALTLNDRLQREREVLQVLTTDLPLIPTYINANAYYQKKGVTGNLAKTGLDIMNSQTWNIYQWDKQ